MGNGGGGGGGEANSFLLEWASFQNGAKSILSFNSDVLNLNQVERFKTDIPIICDNKTGFVGWGMGGGGGGGGGEANSFLLEWASFQNGAKSILSFLS